MKIAVCDDSPADRKRLCELLTAYCARHALDGTVEGFAGGAELLRRMRGSPFEVVFLEPLLEREHGVELAKAIRKHFSGCILFFCTGSRAHALEAFGVGALHYLLKPVAYQHVEAAMDRCGATLLSQTRTLLLSQKRQLRVTVKDILYVEVFDKTCFVHTARGVESTRKTIGQLEQELVTGSFLRCHRSYLVNLEHVRECGDGDFIMQNGVSIPIRQAGRGRVKRLYRQYADLRVMVLEPV